MVARTGAEYIKWTNGDLQLYLREVHLIEYAPGVEEREHDHEVGEYPAQCTYFSVVLSKYENQ